MVTKILMPRLTLAMEEGTILRWLKKEGENVEKGELIVEVFGEKVEAEVVAPEAGVLLKIFTTEESEVPVGTIIGVIGLPEEEIPEVEVLEKIPEIEILKEIPEVEIPGKVPEIEIRERKIRVKASPAAKKMAREHGIDLTQVDGTGPLGAIIKADVYRFIEELKVTRKVKEIVPMTPIRKIIAKKMSQSYQTVPHHNIIMEVDMTEVVYLREEILPEIEKTENVDISYTDILIKAVSDAIMDFPILNSTLEDDKIKIFDNINIGVAVSTNNGLIVPVIHNCEKKSIVDISKISKELINKAHNGKLSGDDLSGGTFTISNLGMFDVMTFVPIINPPESAILGVGQIEKRPVVISGEIEIKPMMLLSLSADHRVIDGALAARFLQRIKQILENPFFMKI